MSASPSPATGAFVADSRFAARVIVALGQWANEPYALFVVAAVCLVTAAFLNSMLGPPLILSDEYSYVAAAAAYHAGVQTQDLPNRLFLSLYGVGAAFPAPFAVARMLNVIALGIGVAALLLTARRVARPADGIVITVAYTLGSLGTFSAYFMPDALYGAVFMAACLAFSIALADAALAPALAAGAGLACLVFIKPHGWVIVGVFAIYAAVYAGRAAEPNRADAWWSAFRVGVAFAVAWVFLQVLLPDVPTRKQYLGALYGSQAPDMLATALDPSRYGGIGALAGMHLLAVGIVAAPALCFGFWSAARLGSVTSDARQRFEHILSSLSAATLLALIGMVSAFTVSVAGSGTFEAANRLHLRLYTFAIPLLILAATASPDAWKFWCRNRWAIMATWVVACALSVVLLPRFTWYIDSPELFFGARAPKAAIVVFGLLGVLAAASIWRSRASIRIGMLVAYVSSAVVSGSMVRHTQLATGERPEDRAGKVAAAIASETHLPIWIVGDTNSMGSLLSSLRIATYAPLDARIIGRDALIAKRDEDSHFTGIVVGESDDLASLPVVPGARLGPFAVGTIGNGIASEARAATIRISVPFSSHQPSGPWVTGLHPPEDWGAWSAAPEIVIRFPQVLFGRTRVRLRGFAMPANAGRLLSMHIGNESHQFVLQHGATEVTIPFEVATPTDTMTIDGYRQLSPAETGLVRDPRHLGIALASLWIETAKHGSN